MALDPISNNLFVFGLNQLHAGGVITQTGQFVYELELAALYDAGGAAFTPTGLLFVTDEDGGIIREVNPISGEILSEIPVNTGRLAAADFDPLTGNLFAYDDDAVAIVEIDIVNGDILSTTDVSKYLSEPNFPSSLAFNTTGDLLFLTSGQDNTIVILNRTVVSGC